MKAKKILFFACLSVLLVGCENASEKDENKSLHVSKEEKKEVLATTHDEFVIENDLKFTLHIEKDTFKEKENFTVTYSIESLNQKEKERVIEGHLPNLGEPMLYRETEEGKLVSMDSSTAPIVKEVQLTYGKPTSFLFESSHLISHAWLKEEGERDQVEKFYLEKGYLPKGTYVYKVTPEISGYEIDPLEIRFTIE